MDVLPVSEQFYSLQGEGKSAGMPCDFLRLSHCNLLCGGAGTQTDGKLHNGATWRCDTIEVWQKGTPKSFEDICKAMKSTRLVITGGEPLMHMESLDRFLSPRFPRMLLGFVEVETNGTIQPSSMLTQQVDQWNVSPKLSNSGMRKELRYKPEVLTTLVKLHSQFKFVISRPEDLVELVTDFGFIPRGQIWLMPAAESQAQLNTISRYVAGEALKRGYNFSNRLHIALWNQKTGV